MIPLPRDILAQALKVGDVLAMAGAFLAAAFLVSFFTPGITIGEIFTMRVRVQNFVIFLGLLALWHLVFVGFRLYDVDHTADGRTEWRRICKAATLGTLIISVVTILFSITLVTPFFLVIFWCASVPLSASMRHLARHAVAWASPHGTAVRHILIVGRGKEARDLARAIESRTELNCRITGFADDGSSPQSDGIASQDVVTTIPDLPVYLGTNVVDEVVLCVGSSALARELRTILVACEEQGVVVRILQDPSLIHDGKAQIEEFAGMTSITLYRGAMEGWPVVAKRLLDILLSALLLVSLAPVFVAVAILVKATSAGSVFFVQERVGLNKRRFMMYKFRTMTSGAEKRLSELDHLNETDGPAFKIAKDPRVTWIGRYLRRTKIDELPQLVNVLKGNMSLVGPRPLPLRDYERFSSHRHLRRFSVRPGMTCLWQVRGQHSLSFEEWMVLDREYIDNWSLLLDLRILLSTVLSPLRRPAGRDPR